MVAGAPLETEVRLEQPVDLSATLFPLRRGYGDPCTTIEGGTVWRATRTPEGPASEALVASAATGSVRAWAWGPGAGWLMDHLPALLGAADGAAGFAELIRRPPAPPPPGWDVVAALARRHAGLRIPRTGAVVEACVPSVLEQKVTGKEARRSYRELVAALGEAAPGPRAGLRLPPAPAALAACPSWELHRHGIERRRAETLRRVAAAAPRLEEAAALPRDSARRRLTAVPGVGPWTAAEVALVAFGDPDAVSIGDFHLPNQVAWSLANRPRGDDRLMLELLEPWRGHRGRVLRLLTAGGVTAPRWGPRQPVRSFREW
ncbi:MAG: DNA-3-methyladenine glycosylase family protein [Acidimicrobiales bacterium]